MLPIPTQIDWETIALEFEHKRNVYYLSLSRARTIKNTFGLLAARWRIFRRQIIAGEKTVHAIIQATVVLHNYVITNKQMKGIF